MHVGRGFSEWRQLRGTLTYIPELGRETEVGTAAVSTTSGTTATDHQAEHTSDAQVQKRRRTSPLPDYVPSTKMWPMGSKTVSKKPAAKRQTGKRTRKADAQECDTNNQRNKRQAVSQDGSAESHKTKQPAKVCTKSKLDSAFQKGTRPQENQQSRCHH